MPSFAIRGGKELSGELTIAGSKNAVLPMMAASLLTRDTCLLTNVPDIMDVANFAEILRKLGADVRRNGRQMEICCARIAQTEPDRTLVSSMRASIVLLGALLGRNRSVDLSYPGGDLIGARPIDVHLRAFRGLGAKVKEGARIRISSQALRGAEVFAESSVTGTENILLAAACARGTTIIKLAAEEPHVAALARFLVRMGARISGIGTHTLTIRGASRLHGARMHVIPDMIEAGSFAILAAAAKSEIVIHHAPHDALDAVYNKFSEIGVRFTINGGDLILHRPRKAYQPSVIRTGLYPNLATDLQPPFGVLATQAAGTTVIHDWIFEGRLGYLQELAKMGARTEIVDAHQAKISGPTRLSGALIRSRDIRSGMTLLIAALVAGGESRINDIHHIDRGYERIDERLRAIGADIQRID